MNTYINRTNKESAHRYINGSVQKEGNTDSSVRFVDYRPEAITQRKLRKMADTSPQARQIAQFQDLSDHHSTQQPYPIPKKEDKTGLPDNLKNGIEALSGYSMDDVKVHYNSAQPAQLQAHAYTQGTDVHVASGQEQYLPHEAWHVVQQKQGRVQPTKQLKTTGLTFAKEVLQGQFVDENGIPSTTPVLKQVEQYIEKHNGSLLGNFREWCDSLAEKSLNAWVFENLGISVMAIQKQLTPDRMDMEKEEIGFSFEEKGRRIYTHYEGEKHKETGFLKQLDTFKMEEGKDFSYKNVRSIMESVLTSYPYLTIEDINSAISKGIENFHVSESKITLEGDLNADLQLLAQHLLRYQSFNRRQLRDKPENRKENTYRRLELEKSKRMLQSSSSRKDLDRLVPPTPDLKEGKGLQDAMPGLIDLNRPLENSIFSGETYKAVFVLAHKLFRDANDCAQESLKKKKKEEYTIDEQLDEQRKFFNTSLFGVVSSMEEPEKNRDGKSYLTGNLGFTYDSGEESFDEGDAESSDESGDLSSDKEIYNSEDNLFSAKEKRNLLVNSMGLFSKTASQKELLDGPSKQKKHQKIRRKINRRSRKLSRKYDEPFSGIVKEWQYYSKKDKDTLAMEKKLRQEREILRVLESKAPQTGDSQTLRAVNPKASDTISKAVIAFNEDTKEMPGNSIGYKDKLKELKEGVRDQDIQDRKESLKESMKRLRRLRTKLTKFYTDRQIGDVVVEQKKKGNWRAKKNKKLFSRLGPKGMEDYVMDPPRAKRKKTMEDSKRPTKKRKL